MTIAASPRVLAGSIAALMLIEQPPPAAGQTAVSGSLISNISSSAATPTDAVFTTDAEANANIGATIFALNLNHGLTLTQLFGAQAGNANAPLDTLVLSSGTLSSTASSVALNASLASRLQFGPNSTAPAVIALAAATTVTLGTGVIPVTAGGLSLTGPGTLAISGTNQITGPYDLGSGKLVLPATGTTAGSVAGGTNATLDLGAGTITVAGADSTTFAGTLLGSAGSILRLGSMHTGVLALPSSNVSPNLAIEVQGGTLLLSGGAVTSAAGLVRKVEAAGTLALTGGTVATLATSIGGTGAPGRTGAIELGGGSTLAGAITLTNAGTLGVTDGTSSVTAAINGVGKDLTFNPASAAATLLIDSADLDIRTLTKTGAGTVEFRAPQSRFSDVTVNGGTLIATSELKTAQTATVNAGGLLRLAIASALPSTASVMLNGDGALALSQAQTIRSLSGGSASTVTLGGSSSLTVMSNQSASPFAGVISGSGGLIKASSSTFTLTGSQVFSGPTVVNLGTLALGPGGNLNGLGAVSVAGGAALAIRPGTNANTSIAGAVTLASGSTLTMVDGATSQLTLGGLDFSTGAATLALDFGGTTSASVDRISVLGTTFQPAAGARVTVNGFGSVASPSGVYPIIDAPGISALPTNPFSLSTIRVATGGRAYPISLSRSDSSVLLTVGPSAGRDRAFWRGGIDGNWATNNAGRTNWASDASGRTDLGEIPGTLTDLFFSAVGAAQPITTATVGEINSLTFGSDSGPVTVTGPLLRLNAGAASAIGLEVTGGNSRRTIASSLGLLRDQSWVTNGAPGSTTLELGGGTVSTSTPRLLTISGSGNTLISGALAAGSISGLVKSGQGTLTLASSANAFSGPISITGGVLAFSADAQLGAPGNLVALNPGGTLRLTTNQALGGTRSLVVNGTAANPSGLDVPAGITGTLAHSAALTGAGTLLVSTTGGSAVSTLSVDEELGFTGAIAIGAPGRLIGDTLSQSVFSTATALILRLRAAGKLAAASGITINNGALLQISQGEGLATNRIAAALTFHNGRFQYDPAGSNPMVDSFGPVTASGVLTLSGSPAAGPAGGTSLNFGALTRTGNATLALQPTGVGTGSIGGPPGNGVNFSFNGLTDSGGAAGTPTRAIVPWAAATSVGAPLEFSSLVTYDANGFRPLSATEVSAVTSQAAFDAVTPNHNVDVSNQTFTVSNTKTINALTTKAGSPTFVGSGTLSLGSGAVANLNTITFGSVSSFDSLKLNLPTGGGHFHLGSAIVVKGTASIRGGGSNGLTVSSLNADADHQLRLTNTVANTFTGGLFINGNAQVTFTANNQLGQTSGGLNAGAITLGGGQLIYTGTSRVLLFDGLTERPITVTAAGGTIGVSNDAASLSISGVINGPGQMQFGGAALNHPNGRVELDIDNTYSGGTLISPGVLAITNPTALGTGPVLLNGGTLELSGPSGFPGFTVPLTVIRDSALTHSRFGGFVWLRAGIAGAASPGNAPPILRVFARQSFLRLEISGESTFSGTLDLKSTDTVLSGTLNTVSAIFSDDSFDLRRGDAISDAAALSLRGNFNTYGFSETVGPLTVTGELRISLWTGANTLRFASSDTQPWTGPISVLRWSGSLLGGGTDQLFFGTDATGLTADQLNSISFTDPEGFAPGVYPAAILATGEIVPVPEPGATTLFLTGLGLLAFRPRRAERRR